MLSNNKKSKKQVQKTLDNESLAKINFSADTDKNGTANLKELYGMFRQNRLSRFESMYNAVFIHCLNKISHAVKSARHPENLFSHPAGWFKNKENFAKKSIWNLILSLLLFMADTLAKLRLVPKNIYTKLEAAGEGFENSATGVSFFKKVMPYVFLILFAIGVFNYTSAKAGTMTVIDVYVDGERVGYIKNKEIFYSAMDIAENNLSNRLGLGYKIPDGTTTFKVASVETAEFLSDSEVAAALVKSSDKYLSIGYGLYIDNTLVAVGPSRMIMDNILSETLELYNTLYSSVRKKDELAGFANIVKVYEITVPKTFIKTEEEIRAILGLDELSEVSDLILRDNRITALEVSNMLPTLDSISNKDFSEELPTGAIYYLDSETHDSALGSDTQSAFENIEGVTDANGTTVLSFKTTKTVTMTEIMPCDVEYIYDDDILAGRKIVSVPGVDGIKRATYDISYVGDVEIERKLVKETVIKKPSVKKVRVGTKPASEFDSSTSVTGTFIRPCDGGSITSYYSGRTIFGAYEFHGALDIADRYGTPIRASDGGEVVFAGWNGTYGNCIIIDHGDGIETLYAHLSAYAVQKGDKVGQGWKIGEMGSTGRATGDHIHFEVRVNGVRQDPLDYIEQ